MQLLAHQWAKRLHVNTNMYIIFSYFLKEKYNYLCSNLYLIQVYLIQVLARDPYECLTVIMW